MDCSYTGRKDILFTAAAVEFLYQVLFHAAHKTRFCDNVVLMRDPIVRWRLIVRDGYVVDCLLFGYPYRNAHNSDFSL